MVSEPSLSTPAVYHSPMTQITQKSLDVPTGQDLGSTTQPNKATALPDRNNGGATRSGHPGSALETDSGREGEGQISTYMVGGKTIKIGSSPTIIAGTTYSLAPSGCAMNIDGTMKRVRTYVVDGETVVAGASPTVISGTTYCLAASGGAIYVDGTSKSVTIAATDALVSASASGSSPSSGSVVLAKGDASSFALPGIVFKVICGLISLV